ncbi:hypothetical protein X975_01350, partial [Stegodyphus mimosarum]
MRIFTFLPIETRLVPNSAVSMHSSCSNKMLTKLLLFMWTLMLSGRTLKPCSSFNLYHYAENYTFPRTENSSVLNISHTVELATFNLTEKFQQIPTIFHIQPNMKESKENETDLKTQNVSKISTLPLKNEIVDHVTDRNSGLPQKSSQMENLNKRQNPLYGDSKSEEDSSVVVSTSDIQSNVFSMEETTNTLYKRLRLFSLPAKRSENKENENSSESKRNLVATSRQFLFHPFLPYGKDLMPDEKISIHDILPVRMVKFVKSMVEEAPWEQMFMKMVRMVVDQFVDKIIEKMFAHKDDDHDKWRSSDVLLAPTWVLPTFATPVVRLRRSADTKPKEHPARDLILSTLSSTNELELLKYLSEEKGGVPEARTWLDEILDYIFPDSKTDSDKMSKRDVTRPNNTIENEFLKRLLSFLAPSSEESVASTSDSSNSGIAKNNNMRYSMLKEKGSSDVESMNENTETNNVFTRKAAEIAEELLQDYIQSKIQQHTLRSKRSLDQRSNDRLEKRLWQATLRQRPQNSKRDNCSLRRACNAGRLLSRLPSVEEITLQLRSYGNEPHWDALIWGMKKKRCSRILCKHQRSPKGSRQPWNLFIDRPSRRNDSPSNTDFQHNAGWEDNNIITYAPSIFN